MSFRFEDALRMSLEETTTPAVKPHVPMIKFPPRNPLTTPQVNASNPASASKPSPVQSNPVGGTATKKGSTIDSSELPLRYKRQQLSSEEMEHIEKGGPV